MPDEPAQPSSRPTLAYATPAGRGDGDFRPEVEALIDRNQGVRAIRRYFRTPEEAAAYFVQSLSRRYPKSDAVGSERCVECRAPAAVWATASWTVEYPYGAIYFRKGAENKIYAFTHHAMCEQCYAKWSAAGAATRLRLAGAAGLCLSLVGLSASAAYLRAVIRSHLEKFAGTVVYSALSMAVVSIVMLIVSEWLASREAPPLIRQIGQPGVRLFGLVRPGRRKMFNLF